jgi:hypothetical protein
MEVSSSVNGSRDENHPTLSINSPLPPPVITPPLPSHAIHSRSYLPTSSILEEEEHNDEEEEQGSIDVTRSSSSRSAPQTTIGIQTDSPEIGFQLGAKPKDQAIQPKGFFGNLGQLFDGYSNMNALQMISASLKKPEEPGYDWSKFKAANETVDAYLVRRREKRR